MLISLQHLLAFLPAAILLTLAPGPDNLMVLTLSLSQGSRRGIAFAIGCATGCISHTLLVIVGVSALLLASPRAFLALQLLGTIYLLYLALQLLRKSPAPLATSNPSPSPATLPAHFARGFLANAINPKIIPFFYSFLPQFIPANSPRPSLQLFQLGLLFALQTALIFSLIATFAGNIGSLLSRRPALAKSLRYLSVGTFAAIALTILVGAFTPQTP